MPQILNKKEIRVNKDDDFEKCNGKLKFSI